MKRMTSILLTATALLAIACNDRKATGITGVYVVNTKNEFRVLEDTLTIEVYNEGSGVYQIAKRSGYQLIRNGKLLPKQFRLKSWKATYDQKKQLLSETALGRQVYLNVKEGTLSFGETYHKVK